MVLLFYFRGELEVVLLFLYSGAVVAVLFVYDEFCSVLRGSFDGSRVLCFCDS